jgi:hypothetical protein
MTVEELKKERDALAASISGQIAAFQERTGVFVNGIAVQTITTRGGGIGGRPSVPHTETRVGVGISLEQP